MPRPAPSAAARPNWPAIEAAARREAQAALAARDQAWRDVDAAHAAHAPDALAQAWRNVDAARAALAQAWREVKAAREAAREGGR